MSYFTFHSLKSSNIQYYTVRFTHVFLIGCSFKVQQYRYCFNWTILVMTNSDPWDIFFYPTLTLMRDSYSMFKSVKYKL